MYSTRLTHGQLAMAVAGSLHEPWPALPTMVMDFMPDAPQKRHASIRLAHLMGNETPAKAWCCSNWCWEGGSWERGAV